VWFYQAVVQAILLYGSKTRVISQTALAQLEGFHIHLAYQMAKQFKPKCNPGNVWLYPQSEDVLKECGIKTMEVTHLMLFKCRAGEHKRGAISHQWW
jgi:hypothetical protein